MKKSRLFFTRMFSRKVKESKSTPGPKSDFWFWAADAISPRGDKSGLGQGPQINSELGKGLPSADELAQNLLLKNPHISAATFLNMLKANRIKFVIDDPQPQPPAKDEKEADGSSGAAVGILASSGKLIGLNCRFMEGAGAKDNGVGPTKYKVALIEEGLGNLGTAFYYMRSAIESGVQVFEGKKCYADHPAQDEEQNRPERSVRDIVGHFENLHIEESAGGAAILAGDLILLPDKPYEWARALVRHAVDYGAKYPDKSFIGLSVNASGDAEPRGMDDFLKSVKIPEGAKAKILKAQAEGVSEVRVVNQITEAISCDIVTEPGAKGAVLEMIEGEKGMKQEETKQAEEKKEMDAEPAPDQKHDDKDQDVELIKKMIKKHMGDDAQESEEAVDHMKQAVEAYMEMGYSKEEAMEAAGHAMKLAKHMQAKKEGEDKEALPPKKDDSKKDDGDDHDADDEKKEKKEAEEKESEEKHEAEKMPPAPKKESEAGKLKAENLALRGTIAAMRERNSKSELQSHIDTKLAETKLPRAVTKEILESIGSVKNKAEFDRSLEIFMKGYKKAGHGEVVSLSFIETEKTGGEVTEGEFKLSDCLVAE